jgi:hypothetical protein
LSFAPRYPKHRYPLHLQSAVDTYTLPYLLVAMKYLDYPLLSELSSSLSSNSGPDVKLNVRIEAYSVKPVGKEKKMFKNMEDAYASEQDEMVE